MARKAPNKPKRRNVREEQARGIVREEQAPGIVREEQAPGNVQEEQDPDNVPAFSPKIDFSENNSLARIFWIALLFGFPVSPNVLNSNTNSIGLFQYMVCCFLFLARLLFGLYGVLHVHYFVMTRSFISVYRSFTSCGLLLQLIFLFKGQEIITCIRDICMLCREYRKDCWLGERSTSLKVFFFISITLFMTVEQFYFMFLRPLEALSDGNENDKVQFFGSTITNLDVALFIILMTNVMTTLIILTMTLLCGDVFRIMSDAVNYYTQKFTKDLKGGVLRSEKCEYYTDQFHEIVSKFKSLNDAISIVVSCLYVFLMFSLMEIMKNCVAALMINESVLDNFFEPSAAFISVFVLLYLSLNGSDIYENGEKLKSTKFPGEIPKKAVKVKSLFEDIQRFKIGAQVYDSSICIRKNILVVIGISVCFYSLYYGYFL